MCDPILVTLLKSHPHYSQSSRENATPCSGTSQLASFKEVRPPPSPPAQQIAPRKGIQDSLRFWIPRGGFRIPGTGLWMWIPDSLSSIMAGFHN